MSRSKTFAEYPDDWELIVGADVLNYLTDFLPDVIAAQAWDDGFECALVRFDDMTGDAVDAVFGRDSTPYSNLAAHTPEDILDYYRG